MRDNTRDRSSASLGSPLVEVIVGASSERHLVEESRRDAHEVVETRLVAIVSGEGLAFTRDKFIKYE